MRLLVLAASALSIGSPTVAHASPCGGSTGDSSSGGSSGGSCGGYSGSSSSDGGSSSDSSSSSSAGCVNTTNIVGRAECSRFGAWDQALLSRMRIAMGLTAGTVSAKDMGFEGDVEHERMHKYHYPTEPVDGGEAPQIGYGGMELQITGFVGDKVFVGFHGAFAVGGSNASERSMNGLRVEPGSVLQTSVAGIVGTSLPIGSWLLRSDAIIGWRATGMSFQTSIADCVKNSLAWNHSLMLESRVGIEKWLNPWLSVGVMVGTDLMQHEDMSIALSFTGHTAAFDSPGIVGLP